MADTRQLLEEAHNLAISHLGLLVINGYTDGVNETRELIENLAEALSHAAGQEEILRAEVAKWRALAETSQDLLERNSARQERMRNLWHAAGQEVVAWQYRVAKALRKGWSEWQTCTENLFDEIVEFGEYGGRKAEARALFSAVARSEGEGREHGD